MKKNIFSKRVNIKPYEYPELLNFKDAIRHSYWIHTEYNLTSDIQDYKKNLNEDEREVLKRTMLAISQIEVNVKRFWGDLYKYIPKPEIDDVGGTFAESEIRHKDAYSFLLEKLGLNDEFEKVQLIPEINNRIEYLEEFHKNKTTNKEGFILSLILFSIFVEHISLFGQFLILMTYNKERNLFKGLSNIVEATSKEEEIHGKFGIALYEIIKNEHPNIITEKLIDDIVILAKKAQTAELGIIDWIYENGDLGFIPKTNVKNYINNRFNKSLKILGRDSLHFNVDENLLKNTVWFDIEVLSTKETDFFNKREISYSKKMKDFNVESLF
jgi:ribonucleoside-diphosphate reductase beta chain